VPKREGTHGKRYGKGLKKRYTFDGRRGDDALIRYELAG